MSGHFDTIFHTCCPSVTNFLETFLLTFPLWIVLPVVEQIFFSGCFYCSFIVVFDLWTVPGKGVGSDNWLSDLHASCSNYVVMLIADLAVLSLRQD